MDIQALSYPFADVPAEAQLIEVAQGVHWLRMPLPFALDHINLWVLDDGEGVTLVDTGVGNDKTKELWAAIFDGPLAGRTVKRLVCTHFHPDHMGLSSWLCDRFGVSMWATLGEWTYGSMLSLDGSDSFIANQVAFHRAAGFSDVDLDTVRQRGNPYRARVAGHPKSLRRIADGEVFDVGGRGWRVIVGRGHSPEHACLYNSDLDVLISGDQVLPRISPNVSVYPQEPESNPLALFITSLRKIRDEVPETALVLPSHGKPFTGLYARIADLLAHHDDRLRDTLEACAEPVSALDLVPVLFKRQLDPHQMFFAIGESLAHLHYLVETGAVRREASSDGVWRFRAAGTPTRPQP